MTPKTEPLITAATITAGAVAILAVAVAFGVPVTEEQQIAILRVVAVAAPFIVAVAARHLVTPNASVVERANGQDVFAGEANELPTGTKIRDDLGDGPAYLPRHADTPEDVTFRGDLDVS